jgi:hypothetical protein
MTDLVGKIVIGFALYLIGFYSGMLYQGKNTKEQAIEGVVKEAGRVIEKGKDAVKTSIDAIEEKKAKEKDSK